MRDSLRDLLDRPAAAVLVAVSGGPDSIALLDAACFVGPRLGIAVGAVTVDHGIQPGSTARARTVATLAVRLGADPVSAWHVVVGGPGGPEGAARRARYRALERAAAAARADAVLLGHTRDDQAETVLLGLARGSGTRSLAGMAAVAGLYRRPFLTLPRAGVAEAAQAVIGRGDLPWHDPHNVDERFARARVRHRVLPVLEHELGPGIGAALARSAAALRADADALDSFADDAALGLRHDGSIDAIGLSALPAAVRTRVLRQAALAAGSPASDLTAAHVTALDALVMGQARGLRIDLPGRVQARRSGGRVEVTRVVAG